MLKETEAACRFRRQTFVTPKSYLSFLQGYKGIYTKSRYEIEGLSRRINSGLDKMLEAVESVNLLKIELAEMDKELIIKNAEAQLVLNEVTQVATAAEKVKAEVMTVKTRAEKIVSDIKSDKAVAEVKLEAARPALEEAEQALQTIKAADIATVRKLGKPPHLIMRIMDCVLILFLRRLETSQPDPEKPCPKTTWAESLKPPSQKTLCEQLMSDTRFMSQLQNFPKDTINEEMVELMHPYLRMEDYNMESAKKVCGNVAGLCSWTQAMAFFYSINKEVLPLKANLAIQESRLERAMSELSQAEETLQDKQKLLDQAQKQYNRAMKGKQALEDAAQKLNNKMLAAEALIDGLAGERLRWTNDSKEFTAQIERLVGDALLCTGFLSYAGPFNQEFRSNLITYWQRELKHRKIPFTTNLNLITMLTDGATLADWNLQGLPNDDLSIQNGIIVTKASRYPLLIDPQGQGKQWIKNKEKGLVTTNLNHRFFRTHLEDALSLGKALLLEDIQETLDPSLDNVLDKNFIKSGTTFKVKLGDKEADVNKEFKIFITTKLPNPSFSPEVGSQGKTAIGFTYISARTSIIDFTVTMKGLEDQLLGRVILTEKRASHHTLELEAERTSLIESVAENKRTMQMLEDNLLYKLSSIQGSLVEDESLISVLTTTKVMAADVSHKLIVAAETEIMINKAREEFRPVANRGSILYFLICDMSMVNIMYQTSLNQFLGLFDISMARSDRSFITATRINNIIEYLTFEVFRYTCRSLYETHKFLFTLLLALKIDSSKDNISHEEFQAFVKERLGYVATGGAALDIKSCPPKPYKWITDMTWLNLVEISKLPPFKDIISKVQRNNKIWRAWFETDAPEEEEIPDGYHVSLDVFRKLILIRYELKLIKIRNYYRHFTNEPPQGIKAGIKRTYQSITQEQLDLFKYPQWQPMLYSISFLHTVVQERRKFGPLGWNIPYEFNTADWAATVQYFQNHLDDMDPKEGVSWKTIHYMIGEVQYGGRVTDDYDKRLLNTFAAVSQLTVCVTDMLVWFGENIFDDEFCYYVGYPIPKCLTLGDYFKAIEELPNVDSPQAFGLHPNADITYQTNTANSVLDTIISIQPKDSASGGGETRESVVYRLAEDMLSKLPRDYIPHEVDYTILSSNSAFAGPKPG
ncbi:DNAH8 [Cordylochernes scorpioides]|uniref:DNAH8 n=1 Tax=Cordylochernes scorpioides TaxID=51811 RepID=A0ABY6LRH2_9ARAC|nr:DNAH8 [Cordylochernes scorpioides]